MAADTGKAWNREGLLAALDAAGRGALLLALGALCTRAVLTGGHPAVMAVVAGAVAALLFWRVKRAQACKLESLLVRALESHETTLVNCYREGRRVHPYGAVDDRGWRRDLDQFLESAMRPATRNFEAWRQSRNGQFFARWVEEFVSRKVASAT